MVAANLDGVCELLHFRRHHRFQRAHPLGHAGPRNGSRFQLEKNPGNRGDGAIVRRKVLIAAGEQIASLAGFGVGQSGLKLGGQLLDAPVDPQLIACRCAEPAVLIREQSD